MIDILVIGAMKAGSSSMHRYLGCHPQISMSKTKEVNYFTEKNWAKGKTWYEDQFVNDGLLHGDVSPMYSRSHLYPNMAKRAYQTNPDLKIIYVIRNHFERIVSHLMHNMVTGRIGIEADILTELKDKPDYILTTQYYYQISKYLEFFEKDRILIVNNHDLKFNLRSECNRIFSFLNVNSEDYNLPEQKVYNSSSNKRQILGYDFVYKNLNHPLIREPWFRFFQRFGQKVKRPILNQNAKDYIIEELKEDYRNFDAHFGTSLFTELFSKEV